MIPKNTICLWYDKEAEAAARFYAATFPETEAMMTMREIDVAAIDEARRG